MDTDPRARSLERTPRLFCWIWTAPSIWASAPIGDMAATLAAIRASGRKIVYCTNNSSKTAAEYAQKLKRLGLFAAEDFVYTSGMATIEYLQEKIPRALGISRRHRRAQSRVRRRRHPSARGRGYLRARLRHHTHLPKAGQCQPPHRRGEGVHRHPTPTTSAPAEGGVPAGRRLVHPPAADFERPPAGRHRRQAVHGDGRAPFWPACTCRPEAVTMVGDRPAYRHPLRQQQPLQYDLGVERRNGRRQGGRPLPASDAPSCIFRKFEQRRFVAVRGRAS